MVSVLTDGNVCLELWWTRYVYVQHTTYSAFSLACTFLLCVPFLVSVRIYDSSHEDFILSEINACNIVRYVIFYGFYTDGRPTT